MYTGLVADSVTRMLTDTAIRNLKAGPKHRLVADTDGLYIRVHPTGRKTFVYRSRRGGEAVLKTLGVYPALGLAAARKLVAAGPLTSAAPTVDELFEEWYERDILKHYKSPSQVKWRYGKYVQPVVGSKEVQDIARADLGGLLADVAKTAPVSSNRVLTDVKLMFSYAVARGWIDSSPAEKLTPKVAGGREKDRDRVLTEEELVRLINLLRTTRFATGTRYALALILATGVRSNEARGLRAEEATHILWTVPEVRSKNSLPHYIPTTALLRKLLSDSVDTLGRVPFAGMPPQVLSRAMARMKFSPPATPHDLRRTMSTWMNDNGIEPYIVEKCLNHKLTGSMAVYNHAKYLPQKRAAWQKWQRYLLSLRKKAPGACTAGG